MLDLKIKDLIDLVVADIPESEKRIEKMYDWHFEKIKVLYQISLGISASLFVSIILSYLQSNLHVDLWLLILTLIMASCPALYGMVRFHNLKLIHRQFVEAIKIYKELERVRPFILRYQQRISE
ncbi:hypothetical protein [Methanoregula sp. UBA64]|jgi:hypothetical protein|uniref:hypothetical protein n=1 Tax=Methanoregula sp. UBA64 TaxID=1915554 RepID=UPI0025DF112A|nr:hypothetical protein [Methanoregula sp. UBA64]